MSAGWFCEIPKMICDYREWSWSIWMHLYIISLQLWKWIESSDRSKNQLQSRVVPEVLCQSVCLVNNTSCEHVMLPLSPFFLYFPWCSPFLSCVSPQHCDQWTVICVWPSPQTPPNSVTSAAPSNVRCLPGAPGDPAPMKAARTSQPKKVECPSDSYSQS